MPIVETNPNKVGLPGFEPGSRTPEAQSLDQTSRQPLLKSKHSYRKFAVDYKNFSEIATPQQNKSESNMEQTSQTKQSVQLN